MCGIAGIFSLEKGLEPRWIEEMTRILDHRGPDDEGYLAVDREHGKVTLLGGKDSRVEAPGIEGYRERARLLLGHRRLSILDPSSRGHQPMGDPKGEAWIIFNGEIYNYIELREELKAAGHSFRTGTDTEVLLAAYLEWGEDCLQRFNGMWSFVVFDHRRNILFGARDRCGVKPLYFFRDKDYFAFASEMKALVALPFVHREINREAVFDFLAFGGFSFRPETVFRHLYELQPAHAFRLDLGDGTLKKWPYYRLHFDTGWARFDQHRGREHIEEIRELIFEAVRLRLRSDVPIGTCLSGGIDSSSIVCVIDRLLKRERITGIPHRQQVFTAGFADKEVDESSWARMVAEETRAGWHRVFPTPGEYLEDIETVAYAQDTPYGSPNVYAQYRVMKLAREKGVKVLLDGQGGDEIFTGYTMYYDLFFYELLKRLRLAAFFLEFRSLGNSPIDRRYLARALFNQVRRRLSPAWLIRQYRRRRRPHHAYIRKEFWEKYKHRADLLEARDFTSLNRMLFEFFTRQKLNHLLRYEDRNSMWFSLESRTPFADDLHLVEYVFGVPAVYKIHRGWSKYLLRESMRGIIPEKVRRRVDKKGFWTPESRWLDMLKGPLLDYVTPDLEEFVDTEFLAHRLGKGIEDCGYEDIQAVWNVVSLGVWKRVFGL